MAHGEVMADPIEIGGIGCQEIARDMGEEVVGQDRVPGVARVDHRDALIVERTEVGDVARRVGRDVRVLPRRPRSQSADEGHRIPGSEGWQGGAPKNGQ